MGRNLMLGRYYKEKDFSSNNVSAVYYAAKEYLVKVDVNVNSITAYSYTRTISSDGTRKFILEKPYVKTSNFFNSSESNWYEIEDDEFITAYSKILEMTEVLKHVDMKILRDTSKQNITIEDFK